jgi:transposase
MKNKYCHHSHLSEHKFRQLLECFSDDLNTIVTSKITGISRKTVTKYFNQFRNRIFKLVSSDQSMLEGEVEIDESYFGPKRIRGKRGRGAGGKIPVVGVLKRGGKVKTRIVKNCSKEEMMPIIKGKILDESTIYSDGWRSYDGLVNLKNFKHYRVYHSKDEFARGKAHINGIESFWSFAKRRIRKQNGVRKDKFLLHLKESEFRWNRRDDNMYKVLLKEFREKPLRL